MAKKFIQELKQEAIDQGVFGTTKLRKWMTDKVQSLVRKPISKRVLASEIKRGATKFQIPGKMYFFHYSPKLKDKLPYYDSFPLVIIIEMYGDGFLGLNLHYLPLKMRMNLLGKLTKLSTTREMDAKSKIRVSYEIIKNFAKYRGAKPCIKRYLGRNIDSQIVEIPANEWEIATALPLARFKKARESRVHRESREDA